MWDGSSIVICAYALTLILLISKRKEYPRAFLLFAPASVLFLFIMYFPGIYSHLPRTDNNDHRQVFRRIRWLLMMLPTLSFGMTYIFTHMKRAQKVAATGVCALLMFVSVFFESVSGATESGFWDRSGAQDHLYKLPNTVVAMGDTIMDRDREYLAEDKRNMVSLLVSDDGSGAWDKSITHDAYLLRTYISPVQWTSVSVPMKDYIRSGYDIRRAVKDSYDYVLCSDDDRLVKLYEGLGYKELWRMDGKCFMTGDRGHG